MSNVPSDLKYAKTHEWLRAEQDGTVTLGITHHAQDLLGDMVFVEVPDVGRTLKVNEACAVVESVKAASDVYSPISGDVVEANEALSGSPELVNNEPYAAGWIARLKPANLAELGGLMDAAAYQAFLDSEAP